MARIVLNELNEPGSLAEVTQVLATGDVNIRSLTMNRIAADFTEVQMDLEVWDLRQLNQIIGQLKELPCVSTVSRVFT